MRTIAGWALTMFALALTQIPDVKIPIPKEMDELWFFGMVLCVLQDLAEMRRPKLLDSWSDQIGAKLADLVRAKLRKPPPPETQRPIS